MEGIRPLLRGGAGRRGGRDIAGGACLMADQEPKGFRVVDKRGVGKEGAKPGGPKGGGGAGGGGGAEGRRGAGLAGSEAGTREPSGPGRCPRGETPRRLRVVHRGADVPRPLDDAADGDDGEPWAGAVPGRHPLPGGPSGGEGIDRHARGPAGQDEGESRRGGEECPHGGAVPPADGLRGRGDLCGVRARGRTGRRRKEGVIRKSNVVVLVLAAVAAGFVLSAGFNLSPLSDAFLGEKGRDAGSAAPVPTPSRLLPVDIPSPGEGTAPSVVNISTTQGVRFSRPRMRSPFGRDPFEDFFDNFFGNIPRGQKRGSPG